MDFGEGTWKIVLFLALKMKERNDAVVIYEKVYEKFTSALFESMLVFVTLGW